MLQIAGYRLQVTGYSNSHLSPIPCPLSPRHLVIVSSCHKSRQEHLVDIAPRPIAMAGTKGADDRVTGGVEVRSGMLIFRGVAAPDVAAALADAQLDPS